MKHLGLVLVILLAGCKASQRENPPSYISKPRADCFGYEVNVDRRSYKRKKITDDYTTSCGTPAQKKNFIVGNYYVITREGDVDSKGIPHPIAGI